MKRKSTIRKYYKGRPTTRKLLHAIRRIQLELNALAKLAEAVEELETLAVMAGKGLPAKGDDSSVEPQLQDRQAGSCILPAAEGKGDTVGNIDDFRE